MFVLAAANLVVALNFDFQVWAWFFAIGLVGGKILGVARAVCGGADDRRAQAARGIVFSDVNGAHGIRVRSSLH